MDKGVFKKNLIARMISGIRPIVFTVIIIAMIIAGIRQADESSSAEGVRLLEEAIMRAAIHSYAIEGYFPESLAYITENYMIYIDNTRFIVHYDVFATNLLPNIMVFDLNR